MDILKKLDGGDRRSIGRSNEVVAEVLADPSLFGQLIVGMQSDNSLVRMRAADVAEKVTLRLPELLGPHAQTLLYEVAACPQPEVRWHLAQMLPRLKLAVSDRERAVVILTGYLEDRSSIVRTCALQALSDLARNDPMLREPVRRLLENAVSSGSPAMQSRARRLLKDDQRRREAS